MAGSHYMIVSDDMLIDAVDDHDVPKGVIKRSEVLRSHTNFRVAHTFLFNRRDELLVQQLAPTRERHPRQWGSSVAGYLFAGESYRDAAERRLLQELGLRQVDLHEYGKTVMDDCGCKKFIALFVATCEGPFQPDQSHIEDLEFLPIDTIKQQVNNRERVFTPTFLHLLDFYRA